MAVLLSLASCAAQPTPPASAALDVADAALANGAPALALGVAATEAAKHPDDAAILLREARADAALHRWEDARRTYERVLDLAPGSEPAATELGKLVLFSDTIRAKALFNLVIANDPGNAVAYNDLGICFDLLGQHAAAQAKYRQAIGADGDLLAAQVNLALSIAMSGDNPTALRLLRPLAEGSGSTPRIRQDLALLLVRSGHEDEAAATLRGDMSAQDAERIIARDRSLGPMGIGSIAPAQ